LIPVSVHVVLVPWTLAPDPAVTVQRRSVALVNELVRPSTSNIRYACSVGLVPTWSVVAVP
jgi:hypothetical protein